MTVEVRRHSRKVHCVCPLRPGRPRGNRSCWRRVDVRTHDDKAGVRGFADEVGRSPRVPCRHFVLGGDPQVELAGLVHHGEPLLVAPVDPVLHGLATQRVGLPGQRSHTPGRVPIDLQVQRIRRPAGREAERLAPRPHRPLSRPWPARANSTSCPASTAPPPPAYTGASLPMPSTCAVSHSRGVQRPRTQLVKAHRQGEPHVEPPRQFEAGSRSCAFPSESAGTVHLARCPSRPTLRRLPDRPLPARPAAWPPNAPPTHV